MPALARSATNVRRTQPASLFLTKDSTDPEILNFFLGVHTSPGSIVDVSYGEGGIWKGLRGYAPIRCDRNKKLPNLDHVSHWSNLPNILGTSSVVVADPIFADDVGDGLLQKWKADEDDDDTVEEKIAQILIASRQLLDPKTGTLIMKIGDQVHGGPRLWQPDLVLELAIAAGWFRCDRWVVDSKMTGTQSRRNRRMIKHAPSQIHWLVLHPNGKKCPGPGLIMPKRALCAQCGRVVAVDRMRQDNYCHAPRTCRQLAYDRRVARTSKALSHG